jgi:molecular chaperone DnaK
MGKVLGIDLGTTNSVMAVVEGGEPVIIENAEGSRTTPSMVALGKKGERLVGVTAKRQAVTNPENTIYAAKRLIGRSFSDAEVRRDCELLAYEIREGARGSVEVKLGDKWLRPAEISAMVLAKLKADAEAHFNEKITDAVITVPAYFNDSQRKATRDAGRIAGLNVRRIINEPTAAALAYGLEKKKDEKIVVYDLGGGTFDISILEVSGGDTVQVRGTHGDTHLGGEDIDQRIMDWMVEEFKKSEGIDLSADVMALQRLKDAAEKAKHELSSVEETEINLPFITTTPEGPKHLTLTLTRAKLEELAAEVIKRTLDLTKQALEEVKLKPQDIDEVVLVGGQTRMPKIQQEVEALFGRKPHKGINPDEVVAAGAALQGAILTGEIRDVLLLDVTPLTLGIETLGGIRTPLIPKNTSIPTKKTQIFSTASDNQTSVEINVLQGEREMAADNKSLGRFILDGIPPAPRGVPQIEVTFDIDANGILNVAAKDKATGKQQSIRIEGSSGLSEEEVERMRKEAEEHAEEDRKKKEAAQARNAADSLLYTTEKTLREHGAKIPPPMRSEVEEKIKELREVREKKADDIAALKNATEALAQAAQKIGQELYRASTEKQTSEAEKRGSTSAQANSQASRKDTVEGKAHEEGGETKKA